MPRLSLLHDATPTPTNTNMNMTNLITKSETQNIHLKITNADGSIRSQGYYWTSKEAIAAAQCSGGFYEVTNTDTGKLIEAQW
jgi:hypothetical protein